MKPRRHTHSPAYCCCVSVEPGGVQRRADVLACQLEAASCVCYVLTAACTSACAQRVQPRTTRSTSCSLLAGPLSCCRPASGSLRRATRSWTILGATASARTLATAHHAHPESTSTRSHRTIVHHCLQCWSFAHFRSAYRLRWAPAAAVAATVERLAACVWMCVRLCVHCGQLEPAVPPEKTALNFVENSANASQNAIFFSGATRRRPSAGRREKS